MRLRCALLDDFQDAARSLAARSPIADQVELVRFPQHFTTEEQLAAVLADFEIVVTLRERVAARASATTPSSVHRRETGLVAGEPSG